MPTIVLGQDEVDCFSAWVSIEAGLPECSEPQSEIKVIHSHYQTNSECLKYLLLFRLTMVSYC